MINLTNFCRRPIEHHTVQYSFVIVDSISAIASIVGNSLVLVTIWRTPRLHSPSNVLLAGLALSDLGAGLVCQPARIVAIITPTTSLTKNYALTLMLLMYLFTEFSLLTLAAISVDRYLALRLHLRYRELVTVKRVLISLLITWMVILLVKFLPLAFVQNVSIFMFVVSLDLLCVIVMIWCYFKIFQIIRRHQNQIGARVVISNNAAQRFPNIARYKKSLLNMLYIVGFLMISYIPWSTVAVISLALRRVSCTAWAAAWTFVHLNSCVNPVLYCWRMGEIRQAVKEIVTGGCR